MRYIITHGHIFKNAGSTVDSALKAAFGDDFIDHRDDKAMRQGGSKYLEKFILDNPSIKAISSHHLCNPLPKNDLFACIPIYFVRNPIERVISVYNFERIQRTGSLGAQQANKLNLIQYVNWRLEKNTPKTISDYQTTYIGSEKNLKPDERVDPKVLSSIFEKIRNDTIMVGTVEQFDASWKHISRKLNKYFPDRRFDYKTRKNVRNPDSNFKKFDMAVSALTAILPRLLIENTLDIALHTYVTQFINHQENEYTND